MGVPAFYSWLVKKYPKIVENAIEEKLQVVDISSPNPNGFEFHNLYLDMNGIIHPCFHPDNQLFPPTTVAEVFENIYHYIDRLVRIIRPRNLLYLAIDGVAPRAKLNQQRARRYRTAKDNQDADEEEEKLRDEFEKMGKRVLPKPVSEVSDSNVITPGTEFMYELAKALKSYASEKLRDDPGWKDVKVILSDASVPGEGEHKIISFIRCLRTLPGYDPNTRHCLYGLDADLIMLALSSHEIHFSILREEVLAVREQIPSSEAALLSCIKKFEDQTLSKSNGSENKPFFDIRDPKKSSITQQRYQLLHCWRLREYLELDMQIIDPPDKFDYDIERIIDDFIFICFFAGNDFLPHMPTLQIHEGCIDLLLHVYKKEFKSLGGYLVDMQRVNDSHCGYIKLKRVERFILSVGSYEDLIFQKRTEMRERQLRRILSELSQSQEADLCENVSEASSPNSQCQQKIDDRENNPSSDLEEMVANTKELKEKLKGCLRKKSDLFKDGNSGSDKVKLGCTGWKQRYYKEKFLVDDPKEIEVMRKQIVEKYLEGLCWVLLYYFSGVPSWDWYFPYYYAPFASDLKGLAQVKVKLQKGIPFRPFDQLMAVLPPRSAHAVPKAYRELMLDSSSNIIEFYPHDIEVDYDGKRFQWQGICKLPFIEHETLLNATRQLDGKIEEIDAKRNIETNDQLVMKGSLDSIEGDIWSHFWQHRAIREKTQTAKAQDEILNFHYELPVASLHIPRLLEGVQPPEKIIFENDIMETTLWHENARNRSSSRFPAQDRHKGANNNVKKMQTTNEITPYRPAGPGLGFDSVGRGKMYQPDNRFGNPNPNHYYRPQYPVGPVCYRPVTVSSSGPSPNYDNRFRNPIPNHQYRPPNPVRPVYYRPVMVASSAPTPNPNYAHGSHQRAAPNTQNSLCPSRSGGWRPVSSTRPSGGNNPQFMGHGRGRGQFRPNTNDRCSSQYPNQRDPNSW